VTSMIRCLTRTGSSRADRGYGAIVQPRGLEYKGRSALYNGVKCWQVAARCGLIGEVQILTHLRLEKGVAMHFGITEAKTWHVLRDDGSKVCGSGGKIVLGLADSIFTGHDEWMCAKCELFDVVERENYDINRVCSECGTTFGLGGHPYDAWDHKHFAIKDEHRG